MTVSRPAEDTPMSRPSGRRRPAQPDQRWFFCETQFAGANAPWHLRPAGERGVCLGGAADTPALCGRDVSWDIDLEVTPQTLVEVGACARCLERAPSTLTGGG